MRLYRIRRKSDGAYFTGYSFGQWSHQPTPGIWGPSGCFFKQRRTIARHLKRLCSTYDFVKGQSGFYYHKLLGSNPKNLDLFEVIANDVSVDNEEHYTARSFVDEKEWK